MKTRLDFEKPIIDLEEDLRRLVEQSGTNQELSEEISACAQKLRKQEEEIYRHLTPFQVVQIARHPDRPKTLNYIQALMENFFELRGDRLGAEDQAVVGGLATFRGKAVVVMGHQKGATSEENLIRRFGMPAPEGYRKALRLMKLAEKFSKPLITFIDTPGAYPGIESEERGQAKVISDCLVTLSDLSVPTVSVVIGEGGSGGALALGLTDRILMLQYAVYSVISPEGCAAILWRDEKEKEKAARELKLTAKDLKDHDITDEVIPEPLRGAHSDPTQVIHAVGSALDKHLKEISQKDKDSLLESRRQKFMKMGRVKGK